MIGAQERPRGRGELPRAHGGGGGGGGGKRGTETAGPGARGSSRVGATRRLRGEPENSGFIIRFIRVWQGRTTAVRSAAPRYIPILIRIPRFGANVCGFPDARADSTRSWGEGRGGGVRSVAGCGDQGRPSPGLFGGRHRHCQSLGSGAHLEDEEQRRKLAERIEADQGRHPLADLSAGKATLS